MYKRFNTKDLKAADPRRDFKVEKFKSYGKLNHSVCVPSLMNTYSMGISYFKRWLLNKFPKDYFKHMYIEDENLARKMQEDHMNKDVVIMCPSLAISARLNVNYNREGLDIGYANGLNQFVNTDSLDYAFFKDRASKRYIAMHLKNEELEMAVKIRVRSRAEQLDLMQNMKMSLGIGTTQGEDTDMDFHIPKPLINALARDKGFEIEKDEIKDKIKFLNYLNHNSAYPIMCKFQPISGKFEFFIRVNHVYTHLDMREDISIDDGELIGTTKKNFTIEFTCRMHIGLPKAFIYFTPNKCENILETQFDPNAFVYDRIIVPNIPEVDENGWNKSISTQIEEDDLTKPMELPFAELFNDDLEKLIKYNNSMHVSSSTFINIKLFQEKELPYTIDWETQTLTTKAPLNSHICEMVVYMDTEYINNQIITMNKLYTNSIQNSKK